MSRIRTNLITNRMANGAPTVSNGLVISGVTTVTTLDLNGDLDVDGHLNADNVSIAGVVTATTFVGAVTGNATGLSGTPNISAGTISGSTGTFSGDVSITDKIVHTDDTNTAIRFPAADTVSIETAGSTRLHIHSDGRFRVGTTAQPSGTVSGFQLDMGSYPGTMRLMSGAGASATGQSAGISVGGSNHHANLSNGNNYGATLNLYNYNSTDGNSSAVSFMNSNGLSGSRVVGNNASHSSRTGNLVFMTASGSSPTEKLRISSNGRVSIGNATNNANPTALLKVAADDGEAADLYVGQFVNLEATAGQSYGVNIQAGSNSTDHGFRVMNRANDTTQFLVRGDGKVGINSTSPQQALDVKGSINGGSVNQPFLRFHDSAGRQRNTKHYFKCVKGGTTIFDILTVDLNQNFHQALIILYYGARIQAVADSVTYPVHKIIGVNRFNGGSIQFTKNTIVQDGNASTHANIDAVATSSTNYRIRLTYSGTAGGSSFCCGSVEIIGVGSGDDGAFYSLAHGHGLVA